MVVVGESGGFGLKPGRSESVDGLVGAERNCDVGARHVSLTDATEEGDRVRRSRARSCTNTAVAPARRA